MARAEIQYDNYKIKAFIDSNIILECRPLRELPWQEIDADGPILVLVTPTAITEIDSKKQDGRIGKRAREFNRLIAPVAEGGPPILIRQSKPRVELALSRAVRIPWNQHDDLDSDDGDSRIVAEILYAQDMNEVGKLIVSHDIKPITFASNYNLATHHVTDSWLRQPEPHPKDRQIQKLQQKLTNYETTEPAFQITIDLIDEESVTLVRIDDLSNKERASIQNRIFELNPPVDQSGNIQGISLSTDTYDFYYDERFMAYQKSIPVFMTNYEQKLERTFNQARFKLKVVNTGKVQAENLLVEVCVANGWIHDRFVAISPQGPKKPKPRTQPIIPIYDTLPIIPQRVGRHEFEYKDAPNHGHIFSVTCQDFRQGQEYIFEGVVSIDVRAIENTNISVAITASNFYGVARDSKIITRNIETYHISKLVDLNSLNITVPTQIRDLLTSGNFKAVDWTALEKEDS
ncbi:MAG: hypothetical protein AB2535_16635 [Candidatus Thiodiazotropha endolucinida]